MNIPFVDLKAQYEAIKPEIDNAIQNVINDTAFVRGEYVKAFEEAYAYAYGVKHCISCGNGTDAIYIALKSLDIGQGDEVITTAHSWISTSETIGQAGARVVFVDTEPEFFTIDPALIEEKITEKTKAIIPVHLYGQPADMHKIMAIANKYNLYVIEDCAQAHFAKYKNQKVGTFGNMGTFSFFPGKNLGAYGDAGAIITNYDALAQKCRMFANHGALKKHQHLIEGINSRLDGLQAAILSVKLPHIHDWNKRRLECAQTYDQLLTNHNALKKPSIKENCSHVFHLYVIQVADRQKLIERLSSKGISTGIHYPTPLPFLPAYKYLNLNNSHFPVVSKYQDRILSLPIYPELQPKHIEFIAETINEFCREAGK